MTMTFQLTLITIFAWVAGWGIESSEAFLASPPCDTCRRIALFASSESQETDETASFDALSRLPTSVEDQVRQAAIAIENASNDGKHRHLVRLLLPVIGATDLDDWPGGARQMMEAAYPLITDILKQAKGSETEFNQVNLDQSDGVYAILAQAAAAKNDACAVLLPTCAVVDQIQNTLEPQVGESRDLLIINPQWKRRSDFGSTSFLFGGRNQGTLDSRYMEDSFEPTFSLTNLIVEGENIRILRTYPGPWRVYCRMEEAGVVDWKLVGSSPFVSSKPDNWESESANQRDGGILFNYGLPSYQDVMKMLEEWPEYAPKNPAERAMAAFNFIKDTL